MSWDLFVATYARPPAEALVVGSPLIGVHGPSEVDVADLPDALAGAVLCPRYVVQLSVPSAGSERDLDLAASHAQRLADNYGGAVYDPQRSSVAWPKVRLVHRAPVGEERIRVVKLSWYFARGYDPRALGRGLLATFRKILPEAIPLRYGEYEPLSHNLKPGDDDDFLGALASGSLFWTSSSPCFGGSASFAGLPQPREAAVQLLVTNVTLQLDGRALHGDPRWREAAVRLFREVARLGGAFYGGAFVERNVIAKGSSLWHGPDTETVRLPVTVWRGIPEAPAWLAWFGTAYRAIAEEALGDAAQGFPEGAFVRMGDEPMDRSELMATLPRYAAPFVQPCALLPTIGA